MSRDPGTVLRRGNWGVSLARWQGKPGTVGNRDVLGASRFESRSAQALLFGAGFVTLVNTSLSPLRGVNVGALRLTGAATVMASLAVRWLPWAKRPRMCSYFVVVAAIVALVGSDHWHHYSHDESAIAVYPIFFIVVIAWAGLTQPRGTAAIVACLSGVALASMLTSGGHADAGWQCVVVTVPAAAILGEVVSWAYHNALRLGQLDTERRGALEALVSGTTQLHGVLTKSESETIVVATAIAMFAGHDTRFELAERSIDDGPEGDDVRYDPSGRQLAIRLRGQSGVLGIVSMTVDEPDTFVFDAARLYGQHVGTRLEQLRVLDALTDAATHDALTGIGNRRAAQASIRTLRPGDAVFILDLDHFKRVNDSLGHQVGDQVLTQVADYLRSFTRPTDSVARYGGEEFLLISGATSSEDARRVAQRLLEGWQAQRPLVTFSIGYAGARGRRLRRRHPRTRRPSALRSQTIRAQPRSPLHASGSPIPRVTTLTTSATEPSGIIELRNRPRPRRRKPKGLGEPDKRFVVAPRSMEHKPRADKGHEPPRCTTPAVTVVDRSTTGRESAKGADEQPDGSAGHATRRIH